MREYLCRKARCLPGHLTDLLTYKRASVCRLDWTRRDCEFFHKLAVGTNGPAFVNFFTSWLRAKKSDQKTRFLGFWLCEVY